MGIRHSIYLVPAALLLASVSPLLAQNTTPPAEASPVIEAVPVVPADPTSAPPPPPVIETPTPPPSAPVPTPPAVKPPVKTGGAVDGLRPGQFVFEKHDSYTGALRIVAVLDIQRIYVFMDDKLIAFSTISAGKKGKATPTGTFNILQKNIDHKSNLYSNAPMPYMQRLTWDGIALHAGKIPGYAASHGCIRLPMSFAKSLYGITKMGQEVVVLPNLSAKPKPKPVEPPKPITPEVVPTPPGIDVVPVEPQPATPTPAA